MPVSYNQSWFTTFTAYANDQTIATDVSLDQVVLAVATLVDRGDPVRVVEILHNTVIVATVLPDRVITHREKYWHGPKSQFRLELLQSLLRGDDVGPVDFKPLLGKKFSDLF